MLYLPAISVLTLLWTGGTYELISASRGLNPLITLLIGSPLIVSVAQYLTEQVLFKDPFIAQGPCPDCGANNRLFFGDILGVEGFQAVDVAEEEISISEAASRLGYTLSLIGASPGFVNHPLQTYNSSVDFRATFEFPMLLQIGPTRFRLGAEVGTFKFSNYKPIGGEFSGVHINSILSYPTVPGQVKIG